MHRAIHVNGFQPCVDMSEHIMKATSLSHLLCVHVCLACPCTHCALTKNGVPKCFIPRKWYPHDCVNNMFDRYTHGQLQQGTQIRIPIYRMGKSTKKEGRRIWRVDNKRAGGRGRHRITWLRQFLGLRDIIEHVLQTVLYFI